MKNEAKVLVIKKNTETGTGTCSLCGKQHKRHTGPELFSADDKPVCRDCGCKRAPTLGNMLDDRDFRDNFEVLDKPLFLGFFYLDDQDLDDLDMPDPDNNDNRS